MRVPFFHGGFDDPQIDRFHAGEMDVQLRVRDGNSGALEKRNQAEADVARDFQCRGVRHVDPEEEREFERARAEVLEDHERIGVLEHPAVLRRGEHEQAFDLAGVRSVRDADGDLQSDLLVGEGPVRYLVVEKVAVRNHDIDVVECLDARRTRPDLLDRRGDAVDFDDVVDPEGFGEHQDKAADQIAEEILRADADAEGQGAADEREGRYRNVDDVQRHHQEDEDQEDEENTLDHHRLRRIEVEAVQHETPESGGDAPARRESENEEDDRDDELEHRDVVSVVAPEPGVQKSQDLFLPHGRDAFREA